MSALQPCPFCGGEAEQYDIGVRYTHHADCFLAIEDDHPCADPKLTEVDKWQTRTPHPAIKEFLEVHGDLLTRLTAKIGSDTPTTILICLMWEVIKAAGGKND